MTSLEYGLICALIVCVIVGAVTQFAGNTVAMWNRISDAVSGAMGG